MDNIHSDPDLVDKRFVFHDRNHAGTILAEMLKDACDPDSKVLAIPAGGVPVAVKIATACRLEMDIIPVSKILLPWTTESGFGAVAFDGTCWIDDRLVKQFGLDKITITHALADAESKVQRRLLRYRGNKSFADLSGKTVVLVDDGIAAGSTVRTAVLALEKQHVERIIIATPTAHESSLGPLAELVAEIYCPNIRGGYHFAVAEAYENWSDVSDRELDDVLRNL